jgi:hypothetical protein
MSDKRTEQTITTRYIERLRTKSVYIKVDNVSYNQSLTTVNLPITKSLHNTLLKAIANPELYRNMPLVFTLNDECVAYKVLPQKLYNQEKEKTKEAKKK